MMEPAGAAAAPVSSSSSQDKTEKSNPTKVVSHKTFVDSHHTIFKWDIEKFSLICPKSKPRNEEQRRTLLTRFIDSPAQQMILKLEDGKPDLYLDWHVTIEFTEQDEEASLADANYFIDVIVHFSNRHRMETVNANMKFGLHGKANSSLASGWDFSSFKPGTFKREWPELLAIGKLWSNSVELANDTLTVVVDLVASRPAQPPKVPKSISTSALNHELSLEMGYLFRSGQDADLTINCGNRTFAIHSVVVKARSPVFQRMLDAGMTETLSKTIDIDDAEPADLKRFFEYVYTAKVPTLKNGSPRNFIPSLIGLLKLADKYEVMKLKRFCFEQLCEHLDNKNAGEIAVLAHLHSAPPQIRNKVVEFCHRNWKILSNDDFQKLVLQHPGAFLFVQA